MKYAENHNSEDSKHVMVTLVNSQNPGMQIMPTHRLLKGIEKSIEDIKREIEQYFHYKEFEGADKLLHEMDMLENQKSIIGLFHRQTNT